MSEQIIIVDKNDNVLSYKDRGKLDPEDIYRVSALCLTNSKGDILLAQRSFDKKHHPGKWGPAVAGTVEKGETYQTNIVKETREELGLENINIIEDRKILVTGVYNHFTQWFKGLVDWPISRFVIKKEEVNAIKWFSKEELTKDFKNNSESFLATLVDYVNHK